MAMNFWKQKLMAFLHDPPNKPLDIQGHEKIRESFLRRAGIEPAEMKGFDHVCDHTAAAADRFPFPVPSVLKSDFSGTGETPFRHPLGGSVFVFDRPFQSAELAEEGFQDIQSGIILDQLPEEDRDWANFFLHWRRWPVESAKKDHRTLYLPADTRIPDHNIWVHNSVVSAMQGCVEDGRLEPALLLFQVGPVQKFIEQARSTRDLWSGSYLLSWLVAHALKSVSDKAGPDAVIYPALRAQPLFDLLYRKQLYDRITFVGKGGSTETLWKRLFLEPKDILTPSLPNRFLALVPASRAKSFAEEAENSIHDEMKRIAVACFDWLHEKQPMQQGWRKRFDAQVAAFTQITWQICPWEQMGVEAAVEAFEQLCPYQNSPAERLRKIHDLATKGIPPEDRDKRYFSDVAKCKLNNPGFAWPYYYALTDWLLAARRNTRDFLPWITDENQQGSPKDSFSGVEEIIGSEKWWDDAREHPELRFLFRSEDRLGAMNLIKRVWHRAYLADKWIPEDWLREAVRFESVPAVAAAGWKKDMKELMHKNDDFRRRLQSARDAVSAHARNYSIAVPKNDLLLEEWLDAADVELLSMNSWYSQASVDRKVSETVIEQLKNVYNYQPSAADPKLGSPPGYVAVIAFDGDEMGKWVSGESAPPLLEQLSRTAAEYFRDKANVKDEKLQRPLSPSYHLQFSEALSNFGLYLVRPVIEYFNGQLIYSGGDDVLAMVPAASAMDCAEALWLAFRGRKDLAERVKGKFEIEGANGGFVRLTSPLEGQPNWPLVVPGPNAQASVGIAIGHAHSPLQNLVRAAKEAEHRAKTMHGRAASALSLYKRSGEILKWGFKWESPALALFNCFRELSGMNGKPAHFSGRFGYALNDLLAPYRSGTEGRWSKIEDVGGFDQPTVIMKEVVHVVRQQSSDLPDDRRKDFLELCREYLCHLIDKNRPCLADFPMLFSIASFLQRGDE